MSDKTSRRDSAHSDEIDLFELAQTIWKGRYVLLAFCFAGILLAALYAFTAKEQWTSVAYVSKPRLEQIGAYLEQRRAMARVDGNRPVDTAALTDTLFSGFISQAAAMKTRLEYLAGTEYFKQQLKDSKDPSTERMLLLDLAALLQIKPFDKNQIAPYYEFSFSADTPEQAQEMLTGYLLWVNDLSFRLIDEDFNNHLDAQILSRQTELANIDFQLRAERQNRIENIENALHTAKLANVTDYVVARQTEGATVIELSDSKRLFMLGQKYLKAELDTAHEAPIIYPPRYYEMRRELAQLEPLRKYEVKTLSYSYQLAPTLPVKRDKPKRALIIVLGAMVGGLLGCFWVLAAAALRRKQRPPVPLGTLQGG